MDERNVKWTNKKCEECLGWILHDLAQDVRFCEDCGLVVCETELMEELMIYESVK